jgi:hypothetical protein
LGLGAVLLFLKKISKIAIVSYFLGK